MDRRAAVVTGGGGGIGAATALRLARDGLFVGVADLSLSMVDDMAREIGGIALEIDVTSGDSVRNAFSTFLDAAGRLDVVVNCAGIVDTTSVEDMDVDQWHRVFDVNVLGTFLCCQAALPSLGEGGSIINMGSRTGLVGSSSSGVHYAASKAAVINLTKSLAKQSAGRGIRVNVVNPGVIDTPMLDQFPAEMHDQMHRQSLFGRSGRPEEVAGVVAFLASSESSYMTGAQVNVTGGNPM